ncbi:hypothetical protein MPLA_1090002 [Mesorhizobium sp. ORS 3359]|nr:hypothetical protein MPLA_1090002 [Mesorhizobium sp. ORS 3359]
MIDVVTFFRILMQICGVTAEQCECDSARLWERQSVADACAAKWQSQTLEIGRSISPVVILGLSKERSDAAQTRGSMPLRPRIATVQVLLQRKAIGQFIAPLRFSADVTAWIPGSSRWSYAPAPPWDDDVRRLRSQALQGIRRKHPRPILRTRRA